MTTITTHPTLLKLINDLSENEKNQHRAAFLNFTSLVVVSQINCIL